MSSVQRCDGMEDSLNAGIRELLRSLPEEELSGLLKTVTHTLVKYGSVPLDENGRPKTDCVTHAINSIMMYGDAISLLNRARMKKQYLSDYLQKKAYKMTLPPTKNTLCQDVLTLWGQTMPENVRVIEDDASPTRTINPPPILGLATNNASPPSPPPPTSFGCQTPPSSEVALNGNQFSNSASMEYDYQLSLRRQEEEIGHRLGLEFSKWYYERLNQLTDFSVRHFWPECNLRLEYIFAAHPDNAVIEEIPANGEIACAKIKDLVSVKGLWFQPNYETGIKGCLNPHGLAQVMVCGLLYDSNKCPVGVFEQMFGLMKDIRDQENFKIKFTVLRLREGAKLALENTPPEMTDTSLVGIVEEMD